MQDKIRNKLQRMIQHSNEIIENNEWQNVDFDCDCRTYEEGYQAACKELETFIVDYKDEQTRKEKLI